jgi:hypothetical protein
MPERDFGGMTDGSAAGGRDHGIGPTGPDEQRDEASRKGSDMSGAASPDPRGKRDAKPAEEGARVDETPSAHSPSESSKPSMEK